MKGEVPVKVVLTDVQSLVRNSSTWTYEGRGSSKSGLKRGAVFGQELINMDI